MIGREEKERKAKCDREEKVREATCDREEKERETKRDVKEARKERKERDREERKHQKIGGGKQFPVYVNAKRIDRKLPIQLVINSCESMLSTCDVDDGI